MSSKDIKLGVSLYSYQEAIWRCDLDLEGALTAVKGCGGEGVEIFGEALCRTFPYVSNDFLYKWFYMLDNLQLEPVCYEHFSDRQFASDGTLLDDDAIFEVSMQYLRTAKKLGCKFIRLSHTGHNGVWSFYRDDPAHETVNPPVFERLLPYAEELGVAMALEVHGPGLLEDGGNDAFLEAIERTGCYGGGGLMLDFSGIMRDMSPMQANQYIKQGANPEALEYIRAMSRKAYTYDGNNDVDWDAVLEEAIRLGGGEVEKTLINGVDNGTRVGFGRRGLREKLITPPSVVEEYASRLIYIHGKMQWINEDCTSDEIDYPRYMRALVKGGYKGYISSEFEGQRSVPHTLNEVMFVNRQHQLMRKCLAECEAEGL